MTGVHAITQRPIPGGRFAMGDAHGEGLAPDGETPVHPVALSVFAIDETTVTNRDFAAFVDATGHRTAAEDAGSSTVFHSLVADDDPAVLGASVDAPWWLAVRGAQWRHPAGPASDLAGRDDHPVVHVSFDDAVAYCDWAERSLPSEAQWEMAARGGLEGARFPWGDEREPAGRRMCWTFSPDFWGGDFPGSAATHVGVAPTLPGAALPPNGFGLRQMIGNVWEWCADRFDPRYYRRAPADDPAGPDRGAARVLRGGSYLCDDSWCRRYRVAARSHSTPSSTAGNVGFRTVSRG
ncbi:formylglycine-generating enzyme family protein [Williamsia deligens]|uniref:Formylglycine-generating enzyme family protein n=1 Tax=Williamsia deligens TaxID=321325 RepID=A0ABW3GAB2_9NOCA|nr:formylglycine-generating enzyme family protein [Williamsia deligens]MCP2192646.1 Formylglycine-generating enzyme, required for sulfatase activity, contains SUMF1/FGE domain [Williamsia deligens]